MSASRPSLVLFDLDGVLVHYDRPRRVAALGQALDREPDAVFDALFGATGLENRFDTGLLTGDAYLDALSDTLGCRVDEATWRAARHESMTYDEATHARIARLAQRAEVAILTNNGALVVDALPPTLVEMIPRARILCSGTTGLCKPAPVAFLRAIETLGHTAHRTLFLDDNDDNVAGAREAGLYAERVARPGCFDAILACYGL